MRIAQVVHSLDPSQGGVLTAAMDLCQGLHASGLAEVEVLLCEEPGARKEHYPGLQFCNISSEKMRKSAHLKDFLATFDIVHFHTPWILKNISLSQILNRAGIAYAVSIHGMLDEWSMSQKKWKKRLFLSLIGHRYLNIAKLIHCTAAKETEQVVKLLPSLRSQVATIPYVVQLSGYVPNINLNHSQPPFKILFLSRLHPKKGCEILIEAASLLQERQIDFRLTIAGDGERDYVSKLKSQVSTARLNAVTEFTGMLQGDEKKKAYQNADVFALPTYQENFGIVYAESMASGLPIVTTNGSDVADELMAAGAIVVGNKPAAFADALEMLAKDSGQRRELSERGLAYVSDWLAPEKVVNQYLAAYEHAINQNRNNGK